MIWGEGYAKLRKCFGVVHSDYTHCMPFSDEKVLK